MTDKAKIPSAQELLRMAKEAGYDSFGIMSDPELLAVVEGMMTKTHSADMNRLFEVEIGNEDCGGNSRDGGSSPGGANPATLGSALDSVEQGLDLSGGVDMDVLEAELHALIAEHGADRELADLVREID